MISIRSTSKLPSLIQLRTKFKKGIQQGLQESSVEIAGKKGLANSGLIKKEMNAPKSGKVYTIGVGRRGRLLKRTRQHTASAPGESPAVITGQLRGSIKGKTFGSDRLEISANTSYAKLLEKGGKNSSGALIKPRRYLERPIKASRRNIINNLRRNITRNLTIK